MHVDLTTRILLRCIKRWNMKGGGTPQRYAIIYSLCFTVFYLFCADLVLRLGWFWLEFIGRFTLADVSGVSLSVRYI